MQIELTQKVGSHEPGTILNIGGGYGQELINQKIAKAVKVSSKKEDKTSETTKEVKDPAQTKEEKGKAKTK